MSTATAQSAKFGLREWGRWFWRQLTSMRVAISLLFLLAAAAIPGSIFPQRAVSEARVAQYFDENPDISPLLDSLGMFDVYSSVWFSAIYLALFVSLIGCIIPRMITHIQSMRRPPPAIPRRLERLPANTRWEMAADSTQTQAAAAAELKRRRFRIRLDESGGWVAAEKGYLREFGNLLFHIALVGVLAAVAYGTGWGWKGTVVVPEGRGFANSLGQFDSFYPGRFSDPEHLPAFSFQLDDFETDFHRDLKQAGQAVDFMAHVSYQGEEPSESGFKTIKVNEPLMIDGSKVFLLGHGYAPVIRVSDPDGTVIYEDTVIFLPQDGNFTSTGVIKLPDRDEPLGLRGIFAPTSMVLPETGPISAFPGLDNPELFLTAFTGPFGPGSFDSVYELNTDDMTNIGGDRLSPGEIWQLPDGSGTVEFLDVQRFGSFVVSHDPGKEFVLVFSMLALAGLLVSLYVPHRRIWIRWENAPESGYMIMSVAGLAKTQWSGLEDEVSQVAVSLGRPVASKEETRNE